jgi:hypothetical protein
MWNGFIGKQINRSNRNLLIGNLSLLGIPVAMMVLGANYWGNFFAGPAKTSNDQLAKIDNINNYQRKYATIAGTDPFDTGVEEITTTKRRGVTTSEHVSAKYALLKVGEKTILVKAKPEDVTNSTFTGELKPIPDDVSERIISPIQAKYPDLNNRFTTYMMDQSGDYLSMGYVGLFLGLPCAGLALWNLQKVGRRWGKPENHPIAKQLGKVGDASAIASQVEQELPDGQKIGGITITPNWIFREKTYGLDSVRLEDIVWFYQKVTTHRTNGIPTGKTYSTVLHDRSGKGFEFSANENQVNDIMNILYDKAPWAISGYSDDLQKMWQKQRNDLIATVDERRQVT